MIDPITFEVLRHRLSTIVDEGAAVMRNVSGSPSVAQSNDCNVALLTASGEGVIIGRTIASHAISCIQTAKYVLKEYRDNPGIEPGDMFFTNHPYIGTPHQTCGVMVAPIFVGNRLVAWSGAGIHFGDVGGTVPGQVSIGAHSIWDEAMPMPPLKLVEGGILRKDLEEDFLTRSRTRTQNSVDLKAIIGANNTIVRRIEAQVSRYGVDTLVEALDRVIAMSEAKLRTVLREIPDGTWRCENFLDYYEESKLKLFACRLTLTKSAEALLFDFTESSRQAGAVVNATFAATEGYLLRAMLGIFGFTVAHCPAAIHRVVRIEAKEGTIVNCTWPAGVCKGTTSATQVVWQVVTHCLSQMLMSSEKYRDRAIAVSRGNLMILDMMGTDQYGNPFAAVLQEPCLAAGSAAGARGDGVDTGGITEPEVSIPNVESNEFRYPVLYLYRRQRANSGGPGKFRGGLGLSMAVTPHDVAEIANLMIHCHGVSAPSALGLSGGYPAAINHLTIRRKTNIGTLFGNGIIPSEIVDVDAAQVERPPPFAYTRLGEGDILECAGGGGGGYGDPLDRAADHVLRDIDSWAITRETARNVYGVVIDTNGRVDHGATAATRGALRRGRRVAARSVPESNLPAQKATGGCSSCGNLWIAGVPALPIQDVECEAEAYGVGEAVCRSPYVVRERFCPVCWSVVETQVIVRQVEP
jgi:N-methylhydantoinase B